jgi:hypothetical protein
VWQTDFSEFETTGGGIWRICAVVDYATKYCLAITITPTGRDVDALACLRAPSPRLNASSSSMTYAMTEASSNS